jgi:uncharacterized RDD family membrane protein YckC
MNEIDRYVEDVMHRIAPGFPGRHRIEADLRSHLAERVAAGENPGRAVTHMGAPADVARGFLGSVDPPLAGRAARLGAFLFDVGLGALAITSIALLVMIALGPHASDPTPEMPLPLAVALGICAALVFVLVILYFPVLETLFGQTAGKRVFGTFVARDTGERVGFWTAVVRRIPFMFDIWPVDAAFLLFTARRQRAFDLAARTIVISGGRRIGRPWGMVALLWIAAAALGALAALLGSR